MYVFGCDTIGVDMQFSSLTSGTTFTMGKGRNWRVIHPDMGAAHITLNHALHDVGNEFVQHIHDSSDDVIVVLEGAVSLRQGNVYTAAAAGEALYIPAGEVHGTVNTGNTVARMVSFQSPPDMALYRGDRNQAEDRRPVPSDNHISRVLVTRMSSGSPDFRKRLEWRRVFSRAHGARLMMLEYGVFPDSGSMNFVEEGLEGVFIIVQGTFDVERAGEPHVPIGEDAVIFLKQDERFSIHCGSSQGLVLHCCAIPEGAAP